MKITVMVRAGDSYAPLASIELTHNIEPPKLARKDPEFDLPRPTEAWDEAERLVRSLAKEAVDTVTVRLKQQAMDDRARVKEERGRLNQEEVA